MDSTHSSPYAQGVLDAVAALDADALWTLAERDASGNANTAATYRKAIAQWFAYCGEHRLDPTQPPPGADQAFLDTFLVSGMKPRTVCVKAAVMRFYFRFLARHGIVHRPFDACDVSPVGREARATYTTAELDRLIVAADWPERAMIFWHVDHGLQRGHLLRLRWRDVSEHHAIINGGRKLRLSERFDATIHVSPKKVGRVLPYGSGTRAYERFQALCATANVPCRGIDVLRQHHS